MTVSASDIAALVAKMTGIPVDRMMEGEAEKLLHMEERLHERIVDQEEAVAAVSDAIRRARAGLKDPKRPIGRSSSWAPPASARPSWPRRWPSSCSTTKRPWCASTCRSTRSGTPSPA